MHSSKKIIVMLFLFLFILALPSLVLSGPLSETTPPFISAFSPQNGASDVLVFANFVITFNEDIQRGTGSVVLKTIDGTIIESFDVASSSYLFINEDQLIINPSSVLAYSTSYKIECDAGCITDLEGNDFAGITDYSFTTKGVQKIFQISHFATAGGYSVARFYFYADVPDGSNFIDFRFSYDGWEGVRTTSAYEWEAAGIDRDLLVEIVLNHVPPTDVPTTASGFLNLFSNGQIFNLEHPSSYDDLDGDGIANDSDNCPNTYKPDQADVNGNGIGDDCDNDADGYSENQGDCNDDDASINPGAVEICGDGIDQDCNGSDLICDSDGDGVGDDIDNCPNTANSDQADTDGDGFGDACDGCPGDPNNDIDNDNICGGLDNCPNNSNPDQADTDGDGLGDICDSCPNDPDNDLDGDGICGDVDNCPTISNENQTDVDGDGIGDACDDLIDSDGDGVANDTDNCSDTSNPDQIDIDNDGIGDACDEVSNIPGDINGDWRVDLSDLVITLQICAGINPDTPINIAADVDGDNQIGMAEAVFIFEKIAGMKNPL